MDPNIVYKYKLAVNGTSEECFFVKKPNKKTIIDNLRSIFERHEQCSGEYGLSIFREEAINGEKIDSFARLNDKIVILYKLKNHYYNNKYCGQEILDTIEIKFDLIKI